MKWRCPATNREPKPHVARRTAPLIDPDILRFAPQAGPQTQLQLSRADIVIFGGSAGGGKSYGLLLEPLRYVAKVPGFNAVIFRRTTPQIINQGGLWDVSRTIYPFSGGVPHLGLHKYDWPNGGTVRFAHLQYEDTVYDWHGSQITLLCFDELTGVRATKDAPADSGFSFFQFWYMVSRNRSTCGVKPYIRATCNPNADHWVAEFISWWIDQDTGFPILDRCGQMRYVARGEHDALISLSSNANLSTICQTEFNQASRVPAAARARSAEQKVAFYQLFCKHLAERCG